MNWHLLPVLTMLVGATVVAGAVISAVTDEPGSLFSGPSAIVQEAMLEDLAVLRLLSGPQALGADAGHDPTRTLLVVVAPEQRYQAQAADAVRGFLHDGGTLLVADNFGAANSITAALGLTFERVRLVDEEHGETTPASIAGRPLQLPTGNPTAVHVAPGIPFEVLAQSSGTSFLDRDGDGLITSGEPVGPFPLLVEADIGARGGRILALGDPALLMAGADDTDGAPLRAALLAHALPDGGRVVIDESSGTVADPWLFTAATVTGAATSDPWRQVLATTVVALFVVGTLVATRDRWGPHVFHIGRFVRRAERKPVPDDQDPPGRPVQWSRRGRSALLGGLALAAIGLMIGNEQATYAASFLLLASALAVWNGPARLSGRRRLDVDRIHEESTTGVAVELQGAGRRPLDVEVLDALPRDFDLVEGHNWFRTTLRPKKAMQVRYGFKGALRGPHEVGPLLVRTSDVFRLRTVETNVEAAGELLVLPRNDPISRIPFQSKIPLMTLGPHLVNRSGDGTEFHSLRDYQTGDSIRIVNWKASARSKDLVVNQRVHESMATITVFLDARAVSGAGPVRDSPLNEGCRAVLSIVTGALQARDKVRLFVYGDGVREACPEPGPDKGHRVADVLAGLEARGDTPLRQAIEAVLPEIKARSPFVLISGLEDDPTVLEGLAEIRRRGALPFIIAMRLGTRPDDPDERPEPDAHAIEARQKKTVSEIQATETPVLEATPGMPLGVLFKVGLR